ncbi:DUF3231 family protein [Sediminibacillus massiliensis]|uniref:DUF3231 family protein n=1 Tax=Sediminibacillus massiliensis TaxID=1926277 RepID=UPI0009884470|nr:DUF3231 family protein [Sediminibacillus massiliensis]
MGIMSGNQKNQPLHYGEVFGIWSFLAANKGMIAGYQTMANHTGDRDLKKYIEDTIQAMKQESEDIEEVLKNNGIALPPSPPERAKAALEQIPPGARFNDPEISAALSRDVAQGLVACSQVIGQCIREDIAMMFGQMHMNKAQMGAKLLRMNKEKGWLIPPPLHNQNFED